MTRPHYETKKDREAERKIVQAVLQGTGLHAVQMPEKNRIRWRLTDTEGNIKGWMDARRRYCGREAYPTFMMSKKKWDDGLYLTDKGGKPVYIAVEWDDGVYVVTQNEVLHHITTGTGGRTDRGDPKDIEPCVYIPVNLFRLRAARHSEKGPRTAGSASSRSCG